MDWDTLFMNMVHLVAMKSRDPSSHIGAVIVAPNNEVISIGYNGLPRNVSYKAERLERPEKYLWIEHSERNALYNAARQGIHTIGCRIYTSGCPCCDCARGIIQAGIVEVIGDKRWDDQEDLLDTNWNSQAKRSLEMFKEAEVNYRQWNGNLIQIHCFMRGTTLL